MRPGIRSLPWLAAICLLASPISAARAYPAAQSAPSVEKSWSFDATIYLWGLGLDGDVKIGRLPAAGVEAGFSDLLEVLDIGLMGAFEARRGRWGVLIDTFYVKLSDTTDAANPAFGEVSAELVNQIYTLGGSYRALEGRTSVDVIGGGRYFSLDNDLELSGGIASGRSVSDQQGWWDGFVGARVLWHPADRWSVMGYADVGAGGSDLTWQAAAGGEFGISKLLALKFGYRYLSYDYEHDDFVYQMAMAGSYLGLGFRF